MSSDTGESVDAQVRALIEARLNVRVDSAENDLIASGLLDSLALVMLIAALEDAFDCELPLDDFDPENFRTIAGIADFVRSSGELDKQHGATKTEALIESRPRVEALVADSGTSAHRGPPYWNGDRELRTALTTSSRRQS